MVVMEMENGGKIKIQLDETAAPKTVKNFEDLVKKGGIFAHMVALQTQSQSWSLPGSTKERP